MFACELTFDISGSAFGTRIGACGIALLVSAGNGRKYLDFALSAGIAAWIFSSMPKGSFERDR